MLGHAARNPCPLRFACKNRFPNPSCPPSTLPVHQRRPVPRPCCFFAAQGVFLMAVAPFFKRLLIHSTCSIPDANQVVQEPEVQHIEMFHAKKDDYGGVTVEIKEPMDSKAFTYLLRNSMLRWRQEGKKGVWIKLPIEHANLVEAAVKEGFLYHHAQTEYLMLVHWIPNTPNTLPSFVSHRVGIGALVVNSERKVLVVQENSGFFKGKGVWKFPTGVVNEGEDIYAGAIREVKEETGIDTEFMEVLAFRQSHKSKTIFGKSDLFFVCQLRPLTSVIHKQDSEIEAAEWMPVEEYASQPFVQEHEIFRSVADICMARLRGDYTGFSAVPNMTGSGKTSSLYFSNREGSEAATNVWKSALEKD